MKKLFMSMAMLAMIGMMACQQPAKQRYFTESPEIDQAKEMIKGYLANDYSSTLETYTDDVEIHHNSMETMTPDQLIEGFNEQSAILKSKDFVDPIYEMVIDRNEESWVLFWSEWKGELVNGKTVSVPVHVAWRFVDGKIDREWAYYDNMVIASAMAEEEESMEEDSMEDEEKSEDNDS